MTSERPGMRTRKSNVNKHLGLVDMPVPRARTRRSRAQKEIDDQAATSKKAKLEAAKQQKIRKVAQIQSKLLDEAKALTVEDDARVHCSHLQFESSR